MQTPDFETRVARLEKENYTLKGRLEKLEKRRRTYIPEFLANVLLLLAAGVLVGYLGFFPRGVDRLPLQARTVEAEEFVLRNREGVVQARLVLTDTGFRFVDEQGKTLFAKP
jgi:hypothetical protein